MIELALLFGVAGALVAPPPSERYEAAAAAWGDREIPSIS